VTTHTPAGQRGSAMIEVLVSMLLFSVGVLGLVRVLAIAVRDAGEVEYRAIAATVADETIGRMWLDRADLASYAAVDAEVPELPGGTQTIAVDGNVVTVTVNWLPPGAADARVHTVAATLTGN
jgi:type IV pilus assembly protein PilV